MLTHHKPLRSVTRAQRVGKLRRRTVHDPGARSEVLKSIDILAVFVGAGVGGALRYALGGWIADRWGASFPWHTLVINVGGALLLGILMALTVDRGLLAPYLRILLGVGVLGGFTTFSTLSYESVALLEQGAFVQGLGNMFGSAVLGIAAAALGLVIGRAI